MRGFIVIVTLLFHQAAVCQIENFAQKSDGFKMQLGVHRLSPMKFVNTIGEEVTGKSSAGFKIAGSYLYPISATSYISLMGGIGSVRFRIVDQIPFTNENGDSVIRGIDANSPNEFYGFGGLSFIHDFVNCEIWNRSPRIELGFVLNAVLLQIDNEIDFSAPYYDDPHASVETIFELRYIPSKAVSESFYLKFGLFKFRDSIFNQTGVNFVFQKSFTPIIEGEYESFRSLSKMNGTFSLDYTYFGLEWVFSLKRRQ